MILWISLVFVVITFIFVSDFTNLGLFPPYFSQICQGLVNLVYWFKEPAFCFIDSLYGFFGLYFINLALFLLYLSCLFWVLLVLVFLGV
jgi:hypothetical protein